MKRLYGFLFALLFATAAHAQSGTVTNHAFAIGKGAGVTGYTSLLCGAAQLAVGQAAADPICRTMSGDAAIAATGVLTFTAVNANIGVCGDGTHVAQVTLNSKGLATACVSTAITGAPPTGAAGGALAGSYPNPTLATMLANTTLCNATAGVAGPTNCNAATMRTSIGVTATGADTTYNFRANNLSDVGNAATARTNLGLAIGTNVEAWDADLDCIAAISATGIIKRTGVGTCSAGTVAVGDGGTGQITLTANAFLTGNGTSGINQVAINGLVLGNGASAPAAYGGTSACSNQFMTALSAIGAATCTTDVLASAQHANQGTTTTLLHGNGAGNPAFGPIVSADMNITATSCTNQFVTAISAGGVGTCTTDTLAGPQHANQGTTTTVLHGNAAGNPAFGAVSLTADVVNILPVANGGLGVAKLPYLARATATFTTDATSSTSTVYHYKLTGGGGGAGGTNSVLASAGGAGGGGTCSGFFSGVAASTAVTVVLGTGGTGGANTGTNGTSGGSSTIAATGTSTVTATGGGSSNGAITGIITSSGVGGTCSTGTSFTAIPGGGGAYGQSPTTGNPVSGFGGGTLWGPGGSNANPSQNANGGNGLAFGAGGGGAAGATGAGGNGANGYVEITWVSVQ